MANTFKFGNGNWAVKEDYALAYNDENGNFKPLPFDFTRASTATRVNKQGLIETVPSGKPRVDFLNNTSGHLLLEPSRTNLITYSDNLSSGTSGSTITTNTNISPTGELNASTINATANYIAKSVSATSGNNTFSCFLKYNADEEVNLYIYDGSYYSSYFNIQTGSVVSNSNATGSIESYGNNWYRCTVYAQTTSTISEVGIGVLEGSTYTFGWQLEAGSYATSYIPTSGSAVTRVAETTNATVPSGIFGTSGGTIYVEGVVGVPDTGGQIPFTAGTNTSNLIYIWIQLNGTLVVESYTSTSQCGIQSSSGILSVGDSYKIGFGYANNDFVLYLNGTQIGTDTSGSIAVPSNVKVATYIGSGYTSGKIKQTKIYNTRLTNSELQALTS